MFPRFPPAASRTLKPTAAPPSVPISANAWPPWASAMRRTRYRPEPEPALLVRARARDRARTARTAAPSRPARSPGRRPPRGSAAAAPRASTRTPTRATAVLPRVVEQHDERAREQRGVGVHARGSRLDLHDARRWPSALEHTRARRRRTSSARLLQGARVDARRRRAARRPARPSRASRAPCRSRARARVPLSASDAEQHAQARERRAQLVRDGAEQLALALHLRLDARRHVVEGLASSSTSLAPRRGTRARLSSLPAPEARSPRARARAAARASRRAAHARRCPRPRLPAANMSSDPGGPDGRPRRRQPNPAPRRPSRRGSRRRSSRTAGAAGGRRGGARCGTGGASRAPPRRDGSRRALGQHVADAAHGADAAVGCAGRRRAWRAGARCARRPCAR